LSAALLSTVCFAWADARAETVSDALVRAYQSNPALNGERARQRATDENVPQAMAGYRPQVTATLGYACRP
jgi:outer membrane protein